MQRTSRPTQPAGGLNKTETMVLLRWVLIIATCYLVLFSRRLEDTPLSVVLFVGFYLASNVVLTLWHSRLLTDQILTMGIVLFDTVAICVGLVLTANASIDFFPIYFLVIFLGALTERLTFVVTAAVLISAIHFSTLARFMDIDRLISDGYILRVPFLFAVALFFGYLVENARTRQRAQRARRRSRRRTELLSSVTHDLKNPLGVIQSLAGLLLQGDAGPLTTEQSDLVRRIHVNVRRVIQLAINLLDAARIDVGKLTLQRRPSSLSDLVADAVALARSASDLKGMILRVQIEPGLPLAEIDALQMERVLANLLDNAIKYTPPRGTVTVALQPADGGIELAVTDSGPGIPREELTALFERFRRRSASSQIEGSGLGLYIVKAIVDAHGGTVTVNSTVQEGTTVAVRLPAVALTQDPVPPSGAVPWQAAARTTPSVQCKAAVS